MKKLTAPVLLVSAALLALLGCGDSATEITGTLPVVTGIMIDTLASMGDTIGVTWTPLDSTLIDGYFLWSRTGTEGPWHLAATTTENLGFHIATSSAYYTVTAFKGDDISADTGLPDNTRANGLTETRAEFMGRPLGFRIDVTGDSLIVGDPSSVEFAQDFVVAYNMELERFIYPGTAKPDIWPGGARTRISGAGGWTAPSPESSQWTDSVLYGGNFFLALDSGYFTLLEGSQTVPDTLSFTDSLVIDGQIQPIRNVRVFNPI